MKRKAVYDSPFRQFLLIILALFLRELKTRFGQVRFGIFWTIAEPMVHIVVLLLVFVFIRSRMMPQVPFELFLITGLIPFFLFRHIVTGLMTSIDANKSLFAYTPVKPIDTYITRTILETVIYVVIFAIIIFGFYFWGGIDVRVSNPLGVLAVFVIIIWMGFSFGVLASILYNIFPITKMVVSILMLPLYFLSAIMYPLWIIPSQYVEYLKYNPVLHLIELFRTNYFSHYPQTDGINIIYPLSIILCVFFVGMYFYRVRRFALAAR
ncbi:MAG: ABC transporter permease [Campylobacteraceae bacterium]|jgi:capsular polysaccharide transport system permease protein|nr:ABC transporter permease [Campylobacteraceae bacterium]